MDEIFSFLIVRNAGHLLPMDIPATALEMIRRFLHKKTFADVALPSESYYMKTASMKLTKDNNDTFILDLTQFIFIFFILITLGFGFAYYYYYLSRQ
jgi:hypothetical protein